MKRKCLLAILPALFLFSCTDDRDISADPVVADPTSVLVHYWNFNALSSGVQLTAIAPDASLVPGASITYDGTGDGYMDAFNPGYDTNARNGDLPGNGFRARNPSDMRELVFTLPTTGYKDIIVSFATARTGSGATTQDYTYTIDGVNYTSEGMPVSVYTPSEDPANTLVTLDFRNIPGAGNNPNFKLRITFSGDTASGTSGNNRFDNVTLEGVATSGTAPIDNSVYLFHYWNFNSLPSGALTAVAPDATLISGSAAGITYEGTGAGYMDGFTPGSDVNARNADVAGSGLRARNPSDARYMLVSAPTTGFKEVKMTFATAKSSASGASQQLYSYSIDGINFMTDGLSVTSFNPDIDPVYNLVTLDFSSIPQAANNPDFKVKVSFAGPEASGTSGNNRFDNIAFEGKHL